MFSLLRYELCGTELKEEELNALTAEELNALCVCAKHHDLMHLVADALTKLKGVEVEETLAKELEKQQMLAVFRYQRINYEFNSLCVVLENAKIPFLPLKGSVIRTLYPEPWMRTSCDIDILVHETDLDRAISILVEQTGYKNEGRGAHDISLRSQSGVHVELHYSLSDDGENEACGILQEAWNYALPVNGAQYRMIFQDDFFYVYHIAHMAKHFAEGGCGIRPFLDLWFLEHCTVQELIKRDELLRKAGLERFASAVRTLSRIWMEGSEPDTRSFKLSTFVLSGGVYGTTESHVAIKQKRRGGKVKYILSRIFVPYDYLKRLYPNLEKHRWLTPIYEIRRWFDMLRKGRWKASLRELDATREVEKADSEEMLHLLEDLGI